MEEVWPRDEMVRCGEEQSGYGGHDGWEPCGEEQQRMRACAGE